MTNIVSDIAIFVLKGDVKLQLTVTVTEWRTDNWFRKWQQIETSGQRRISTKGRIAILSPLTVANEFVRPWPTFNTWFLGPTWVPPNGISIESAVFAWVHKRDRQTDTETDRPTDHATPSVAIAIAVMRPKMRGRSVMVVSTITRRTLNGVLLNRVWKPL